jgi:chromosome segregation ATPase
VKAEEREIELRQKLSTLEEEMSRTTLSEQASIHQRDQEVVSLQQQLHVLAQQRDDAVIKLSTTQDEVEQTQHELSNLQMVLEQFQKDHTAEVNAALQLSRVELLKAETDKEGMRHEIDQLKGQLREASFSLENASHLEHELELREKQYEELQQKVKELQDNLGASQLQITQLTSQDEDKVDKNLVKNLLHGYLTAPDRKKGEVLKLIANILGMSEQAISQATRSRSWLSGWFGGPVPQSPTSQGVSLNAE